MAIAPIPPVGTVVLVAIGQPVGPVTNLYTQATDPGVSSPGGVRGQLIRVDKKVVRVMATGRGDAGFWIDNPVSVVNGLVAGLCRCWAKGCTCKQDHCNHR